MLEETVLPTRDQSATMRSNRKNPRIAGWGNFSLWRRGGEIVPARGNDMANAAAGVIHVAHAARDHMKMKVGNRLAGGDAVVKAYVVTVWGEAFVDEGLALI
jgi:hypothetical protein